VESEVLISSEEVDSFLDLKYAPTGSSFLKDFPSRTPLPMLISIVEFLLDREAMILTHRSLIKNYIGAKLQSLSDNRIVAKRIEKELSSYSFIREDALKSIQSIIPNLIDSFFLPFDQIPIAIHRNFNSVQQYIFRCRLQGVLPLIDLDKENYVPYEITKNF